MEAEEREHAEHPDAEIILKHLTAPPLTDIEKIMKGATKTALKQRRESKLVSGGDSFRKTNMLKQQGSMSRMPVEDNSSSEEKT